MRHTSVAHKEVSQVRLLRRPSSGAHHRLPAHTATASASHATLRRCCVSCYSHPPFLARARSGTRTLAYVLTRQLVSSIALRYSSWCSSKSWPPSPL